MVSERLVFRRFTLDDLENSQLLETDPDVVPYTSLRVPQTKEQTFERLKTNVNDDPSLEPFGVWAVEFKNSQFLGWCMLKKTDFEDPELGYMILKKHWGKGLATEIAGTLIKYGKSLGLRGLMAVTDPKNTPSIRVLEKSGFRFVKVFSKEDKVYGHEVDLNLYRLEF